MLEKTKESLINRKKFDEIFCHYNNYFSSIGIVDVKHLIPIDKNIKPIESPKHENIFDFFTWIATEINAVYSVQELKRSGQFHTVNMDIVDIILNEAIDFNSKSLLNKRILEPSCGTGIFILRIINKLFDKGIKEKGVIEFINNNIIGFDISPEMVYFTKLNIKCLLLYLYKDINIIEKINLKIYLTDATYKPNFLGQLNFFTESENNNLNFIESKEAAEVKLNCRYEKEKFDYIIGNPPYVTLYGRRDVKKSEELRKYYIQNYTFVPNHIKNGKFNLTMFFFEQSIEWLKEKGKLSFIVDVTFFETAFQYLRKYILDNTKIKHLIINLSTFKGVGSGQIIITLQKCSEAVSLYKNVVKVTDSETGSIMNINQKSWDDGKEYNFTIIDNRALEILNKIDRKSRELVHFFPGKSLRTCTMLLDMENKFTHEEKIITQNDIMPYYEGAKSLNEKFGDLSYRKYFEYNKELQDEINNFLKIKLEKEGIKNKKRIGLGDLEVFKSPKLFIRQSAKEIISSISFEPAAANNSLYCLSDKQNVESQEKLKVCCAQLNSTISTFYALTRRIIRVSRGKQPQIKVSDLKKIRLTFDESITRELLEITNNILSNNVERSVGISQIDEILFNYYDLSEDDINFIYKHIDTY